MAIKGNRLRLALYLLVLALAFLYGVAVGTYEIPPFEQIRYLKSLTELSDQPRSIKKPRTTLFDNFSPKSDVVMIGDSITQGGIWSEIFPQTRIANRGVSGDTAADILKRMDTILAVKPQKALIMVGINDLYQGFSVDAIFSNYQSIVTRLKNEGVEVVIQSTLECGLPIGKDDHPLRAKCVGKIKKIRSLNQLLKQYAVDQGLAFVNINTKLSSKDKGLLPEYSFDGVHLFGEGYLVWADQIRSHVE
jgi:lysophospholipase L1-like esterase